MRSYLFASILSFFLVAGCSKETNGPTTALNRKWRSYSTRILKIDDNSSQGACNYQTSVSDFYNRPTIPSCQEDDVYDFTDASSLVIHSGPSKCLASEPDRTVKNYERRGDSLIIQGVPYRIVHLSGDTLIIDYCTDLTTNPPGSVTVNRARVGMKFIRVN